MTLDMQVSTMQKPEEEYREGDFSFRVLGESGRESLNVSGRLGAAVQRAMAMRERSLKDEEDSVSSEKMGIGGMRDLYLSWLENFNNDSSYFSSYSSPYHEEGFIFCEDTERKCQSMRYTRLHEEEGGLSCDDIQFDKSFNHRKRKSTRKSVGSVMSFCRQLLGPRSKKTSTLSRLL